MKLYREVNIPGCHFYEVWFRNDDQANPKFISHVESTEITLEDIEQIFMDTHKEEGNDFLMIAIKASAAIFLKLKGVNTREHEKKNI